MEMKTAKPAEGLMNTDRLKAFSDGVFAIAITLLVLNLKVPEPSQAGISDDLLGKLLNDWPSYFAYIFSFVIIGLKWINHHNIFSYINRVDLILLILNTLLLLVVSVIPFTTQLLADYIQQNNGSQHTATVIYVGTFMLFGLMFNIIWWYASKNYRLVDESLDSDLVNTVTKRYSFGPILYLVSFVLAFFSSVLGLAAYFVVTVLYILPGFASRPKHQQESKNSDE